MRIILATVITLVMTGFLILTTRIWGLGQTFPDFQSPLFAGETPIVIVKANTLAKIDEALKLKSDAVIWVDVRISKGNIPYILAPSRDAEFLNLKTEQQKANPTVPIMQGGKLSDYSWEQINEFYKDTPALKELYEKFPTTRFVLNVVDNVPDVHTTVVEAIKDFKPDNRTLIQSDALVVMSAIKDLKPVFVYGTSVPDLMRLLSFDSLFILPATQYKGDVFIAPFTILKRPAFNDDIITEMRRRHKRIYLGPIESQSQFDIAAKVKADGYITENLPQLLQMMPAKK
ncbi:PI-PLC domain-containing protein [Bdellovibrio svalbardensis]|uniref:Uncharacterized protein n=1 Tax=Bdellovibrio svalbardensis TaxID=2972972 RepID=A0ABT6DE22_9BACT|nr:hypothetical protein [Bdellovibrio svalbardensis]MDG0814779.1 hypothetical protein [Bdellovibrio svalbardensis]